MLEQPETKTEESVMTKEPITPQMCVKMSELEFCVWLFVGT